MAEVINFVRKENCKPPIEVQRIREYAMIVRFRSAFFNREHLISALSDICNYQPYWSIIFIDQEDERYMGGFESFIFFVSRDAPVNMDNALRQILYLATKSVYQVECRLRGDSFIDQEFPRDLLDPCTLQTLHCAGVNTLHDLAACTREDLCAAPGMTTERIYKIEKYLYSLGWSLYPSKIPQ